MKEFFHRDFEVLHGFDNNESIRALAYEMRNEPCFLRKEIKNVINAQVILSESIAPQCHLLIMDIPQFTSLLWTWAFINGTQSDNKYFEANQVVEN